MSIGRKDSRTNGAPPSLSRVNKTINARRNHVLRHLPCAGSAEKESLHWIFLARLFDKNSPFDMQGINSGAATEPVEMAERVET